VNPLRFTLLTAAATGSYSTQEVVIDDLIRQQSEFVQQVLQQLHSKMLEMDRVHRAKFVGNRLTHVFSEQIGYHFEKVFTGVLGGDRRWAAANLSSIGQMIDAFEQGVVERAGALEAYTGISDSIKRIRYAYARVEASLGSTEAIDEEAAYIFADYLEKSVKELRRFAGELDREFEIEE
jgi:hypothetical protein